MRSTLQTSTLFDTSKRTDTAEDRTGSFIPKAITCLLGAVLYFLFLHWSYVIGPRLYCLFWYYTPTPNQPCTLTVLQSSKCAITVERPNEYEVCMESKIPSLPLQLCSYCSSCFPDSIKYTLLLISPLQPRHSLFLCS